MNVSFSRSSLYISRAQMPFTRIIPPVTVSSYRWAHRSCAAITPQTINKSCLRHNPFINTMDDNDNTRALLESNAKWAADVSEADPDFFPDSAKYPQKPHVRPFRYFS
jgi:hypothetical protein